MKRLLGLALTSILVFGALAGCGGSTGDAVLETIGEGVPTEGRPVFYEFFTQG
ncbi:MAG: hypothetical protein JXE06_10060 [Coriobacteriia bacterium]|nr:hypothetical protein [Coriobacteriia bacterium]MBN2822996.1 hypothetical protein [Coriobacteriia bacterium]